MKSGGLPAPWHREYARLLEEKYGIQQGWGGDCLTAGALLWYVQGYNRVSYRLFAARFGPDIFEECVRQEMQEAGGPPE